MPLVFQRQKLCRAGDEQLLGWCYFGNVRADRGRYIGSEAQTHRQPNCLSFAVLDDVMYKAIAVGFAFFTIATVSWVRFMGRRGLGRLLELGSQRNLGT
jgi:hypothetical protein